MVKSDQESTGMIHVLNAQLHAMAVSELLRDHPVPVSSRLFDVRDVHAVTGLNQG